MKVPKYIDDILRKRADAASRMLEYDNELCRFLDRNGIVVEDDDINLEVEEFGNPYSSANRIKQAILDHENRGTSNE